MSGRIEQLQRRRIVWLGVALLAALSCSGPAGGPPRTAAPNPELAASLVALGDAALESGDSANARERFERALEAHPGAPSAHVGLARVARVQDEPGRARQFLDAALEVAPQHLDALMLLASIEADEGNASAAEQLLRRAVRSHPQRPDAHGALAAHTGRGPRPLPSDPAAILHAAAAHPYDTPLLLAAAHVWIERGDDERAARLLEQAVRLADLDPVASTKAHTLLQSLGGVATGRIPVHCYADESVRRDPYWRMRLRLLWSGVSHTLRPLLGVDFMPVSMSPFESATAGPQLASIEAAFADSAQPLPNRGLVAAFTDRAPPKRRGAWNLGKAQFLGRRLISRLDRDDPERQARTLIHEVMHIYGAIHISPDVDSLMNPSGTSLQIDPVNQRIVKLVRERRFGPRSVDAEVFDHTDIPALTEAYAVALRLNLELRKLGIEKALEEGERSRFIGRDRAREAVALDDHLSTVTTLVSHLMLRQGKLDEAANLLTMAARLVPEGDKRRTQWAKAAREIRARARREAGP